MSVTPIKDFTTRQRLHVAGLAVGFVRAFVRFARQGILVVILLLVQRNELLHSVYLWVILAALGLWLFVYAFLQYRFFYYHVDMHKREFVVEGGLFNKSKTVIKFSNIIQVNIDQNILQKMLSIYGVTINTAGSDKVEADLYALDEYAAHTLRDLLMKEIQANEGAVASDVESQEADEGTSSEILQIPSKRILLTSLFSNYRQGLALFFAFCLSIFQQVQDVFQIMGREDEYQLDVSHWRAWISTILFGVLFVVFIPFFINLFRYFFKYYNFSILRNTEGNFSMRYGLFHTKDVIFNRSRVQTTAFRQNKLLKYFDLGYLALRQIVTDTAKAGGAVIDIPGATTHDKQTVYCLVFENDVYARAEELRPRIGLFISRSIKAGLILTISLILVLVAVDGYNGIIIAVFCAVVLLVTAYNYLYYKNYRFYVGEEFLVKKTSVWNEIETVVPIRSTQIVQVSQTFFQLKKGTANLHLRTAADDVSFSFFEEKKIKDISDRILYDLERQAN